MLNLFAILVGIIIYLNYSKESNCQNFHEGVYIYEESEYAGVKIYRTETEQKEVIGDSIVALFTITWFNDCSYILIPQKAIYKSKEYDLPKSLIQVNIINVMSDTSYRYKSTAKGVTSEYTLIKIQNIP